MEIAKMAYEKTGNKKILERLDKKHHSYDPRYIKVASAWAGVPFQEEQKNQTVEIKEYNNFSHPVARAETSRLAGVAGHRRIARLARDCRYRADAKTCGCQAGMAICLAGKSTWPDGKVAMSDCVECIESGRHPDAGNTDTKQGI